MQSNPKKTRNRAKAPEPSYTGTTLAQWQADAASLQWAQTDARFRTIIAILTNERGRVQRPTSNDIGAAALTGARVEGYDEAIKVLVEMARGAIKQPAAVEPDYIAPVLGINPAQEAHD